MITLPANYSAINDQKAAAPAVIVSLEESELKATKTTEVDWGNNTFEDDVDYASVSGSVLLAGGRNNPGWHSRTSSFSAAINDVFYNGSSLWVAVGDNEVATSPDGITWTQRTTGIAASINGVVHDLSGLWVIVANAGNLESSSDGITWTTRTSSFSTTRINGVTHGGGLFIAVGDAGKLASSPDGITWTQRTSQFGSTNIFGVYYGNSIYVAVGDSGKISTSTNGTTWVARTSGTGNALFGVSFGNSLWVTVGSAGTVLTASDPTGTWTSRTSGETVTLADIRFDILTGWWIFVGSLGILSTSEDAITWTSRTSGFGSLDIRGIYSGDNQFIIVGTGSALSTGYFYTLVGIIRTDNIDLGSTPTTNGEWQIGDIVPSETEIGYIGWSSATGAFTGEEASIGIIQDGVEITDLKRYYQVRPILVSNEDRDQTPVLQGITATFITFKKLTETKGFGYNASISSVSALTTKIDFFKESTIGQVTIDAAFTQELSTYFSSQRKNRLVKILQGFKGLAESDFISYYYGVISDAGIGTDEVIPISVDDYTVTWSKPIPAKWESSADDVVWDNIHPVDVMLDIFQNHLDVRDSFLIYSTFNTVKAAIPTWTVSRTITGRSEDSKKLLEELRQLMSCFFIPQPDGKISLKRYDSTEAVVGSTLTDDDFIIAPSFSYAGNYDALINHQLIYYGWDGEGNDLEDYTALEDYTNSTSVTNNKEEKFKTTKDKWTGSGESAQAVDRRTKIDGVFGDAPVILSGRISRRLIALEVGDMKNITLRRYPKSGGFGITDKKFLLIERNYDYRSSNIRVKFLEV